MLKIAFETVISGCAESGHFDAARHLFDKLSNPNAEVWNLVISGYWG